jgi:hypothetical protein
MIPLDHVGITVADYQRSKAALRAGSRAEVDAFHAAAVEAGGTDNGAPGHGGTTPTITAAMSSIRTATTSR